MQQTLTIAKRELTSLFYSPIAYVVLGIFALGSTLIFLSSFAPGNPAAMRDTFRALVWLLIFLAPAISMRMVSEEFRTGTIEPLMTAPVSEEQVIVGKWLGALGFLASLLGPLVVLIAVLEWFGNPDYGPIASGLLGLLLVGGLYLAVGTFASVLSQNQIIAFVLTVFILCFFTFGMYFMSQASWVGDGLRQAMFYVNVNDQFEDFSKGVVDTSNFIYFLSGMALFLFVAVKLLESRRWR